MADQGALNRWRRARSATASLLLFAIAACSSRASDLTQVFVGFDGPSSPGAYYFEDKVSAERSWLAAAIEPRELTRVLSNIDFEKHLLVAVAAGRRPTATGSVSIERIQLGGEFISVAGPIQLANDQIMGFIRVGVVSGSCSFPESESFPFALAVVTRPNVLHSPTAIFSGNFADGCKPPKSGQPHDPGKQ